ncbi:MAG: hypothetical protein JRH08_15215 [Deltaproteobacteria bacterium]|nr:hypothetical protein [Deltaproteobacteria bacterium]
MKWKDNPFLILGVFVAKQGILYILVGVAGLHHVMDGLQALGEGLQWADYWL